MSFILVVVCASALLAVCASALQCIGKMCVLPFRSGVGAFAYSAVCVSTQVVFASILLVVCSWDGGWGHM